MSEISVQAPNSLLIIGDPSGDLPESISGLVSVAPSCIVVGTLMCQDGPTHVRLLQGVRKDKSLPPTLAWEGVLELPGGVIAVTNVHLETYLEERVETSKVQVHVYVNHGNEPDQIAILLMTGAS
ncbi:MAG: hypothetical protein QG574_3961 [Cyanobacteriota bacterium erpe_2018_sw_21hr_WHONDRS-SW48-000092_B_bin.40]|nr:hypothetical protein [Cyanobacteriota bacterium erpe_2018_sw_21hr_WHONDRS-SW48-000092_B_bin.40]